MESKERDEDQVVVPKELFNWLVDYALELRGQSEWRVGSSRRNDDMMRRMNEHIAEAIKLRNAQ